MMFSASVCGHPVLLGKFGIHFLKIRLNTFGRHDSKKNAAVRGKVIKATTANARDRLDAIAIATISAVEAACAFSAVLMVASRCRSHFAA